jgi:hypothetical protein
MARDRDWHSSYGDEGRRYESDRYRMRENQPGDFGEEMPWGGRDDMRDQWERGPRDRDTMWRPAGFDRDRGTMHPREGRPAPRQMWGGRFSSEPIERNDWHPERYGRANEWRGDVQPIGDDWHTGTPMRESYRGRGPKNFQRSDERIREMVCDRLEDHHDIDASDVEVTVNEGEVTLSGQVHDRHSKRLAEDVAESVPGVRNVANTLRVSNPIRGDVPGRSIYKMMKDEVHNMSSAADTARTGIAPTTPEERAPRGRNR